VNKRRFFPVRRPGVSTALVFAFVLFLFFLASCSLKALSDFAVVSVSVEENGVIGTGRREIEIVFSKEVREEDAGEKIRVESDSSSEVALRHRVKGARVTIEPESDWEPHERYWLVVEKNLKDVHGKEMGREFCLPFQSTEELIPVSAALAVPEARGGVVAAETAFIRVVFSAGVERSSVERAFSLAPSVDGSFEWESDRELVFRFSGRLRSNGFYTVAVAGGARDLRGHAVKPFSRSFEYFPNREYPAVERITAGGEDIFDRSDTSTFTLQDGTYVVEFPNAEKDLAIVVYFSGASAPIDRSTFGEGVRVSPFSDWREEWLDDYTVRITFEERLTLGGEYEVLLTRQIEGVDGLSARYELLVELKVNGAGSRFLEFYAGDCASLDVGARLRVPDGPNPPAVVEVEKSSIVTGTDAYGPYILIPYTGTADIMDIGVELLIDLVFAYSGPPGVSPGTGQAAPGVPALDRMSLQDSVSFRAVFGDNPHRGGVGSIDWPEFETHRCVARIVDAGSGNVYRFSVEGGGGGAVDDLGNYMADDVELYFKLIVQTR
jgi:hypothetical protein